MITLGHSSVPVFSESPSRTLACPTWLQEVYGERAVQLFRCQMVRRYFIDDVLFVPGLPLTALFGQTPVLD